MSEKMLTFVKIEQQNPNKRKVKTRIEDFKEVYDQFISQKAKEQSSRCSQCGVPFCQIHCPLHNNIPDWLKLTAEGRLQEANDLAHSTNNMPEICGRICPQDRLCEGNCVIEQSGHGTVTIGSVEKYITDTAWDKGWIKKIEPTINRDQTVGVIGAGPAGLAAAEELRKRGYKITILLPNPIQESICLQISLFLGSLSKIITVSFSNLARSAPPTAIQLSKNKLSSGPSTAYTCLLSSILSIPKILVVSSSSLIVIYLGCSFPNDLP